MQFANPTQAPWLSATSEGLQDRTKQNTTHQLFTLSSFKSRPWCIIIWLFLAWGAPESAQNSKGGPFKRNMVSHLFFVKGNGFFSKIPDHPFSHIFFVKLRNYYAINPSKIIWRNDHANFAQSSQKQFFRYILVQWQNGHCANRFREACYKNSMKATSNNKIAQSPRKEFPKSYFTQWIATISRNPSENNSSIICFRARNVFWMEGIVKFRMLWSSCRAHMWQQNAHTENTQTANNNDRQALWFREPPRTPQTPRN